MSKQILILNGSPRIHGNTAALIDALLPERRRRATSSPSSLGSITTHLTMRRYAQ